MKLFSLAALAAALLVFVGPAVADEQFSVKADGTPYPPEVKVTIVGEGKPATPVRSIAKGIVKRAAARVKGVWKPDVEGSCDSGYYRGTVFLGRYQPNTGLYLPYDANRGVYLEAIQLTPPRPAIGQRRTCNGKGCVVVALYSTAPPDVDPPDVDPSE
jgi:hypothetical protein